MKLQEININLSAYGYSDNYTINENGQIYNIQQQKYVIPNKNHLVLLRDKNNNIVAERIKPLYRKVFNKEYCIDNIKDLPQEQWKMIDNYFGMYYISNYGRVKSYYCYSAKILQQSKDKSGYYQAKLSGIKHLTHRLVAQYFVDNDNIIEKTQVHHIDIIKDNNKSTNLIWLTPQEHRQIHKELRQLCSIT